MSINNIGDMKECGHAEYCRIYDKYKDNLSVFSSYSGGILGLPQMSTAWGIRGMETTLIASECENWEHRREDPEAWTYWKNADLVAALDRAESAESSLAAMRQRAEEAERRADLMEMGQMMAKVSSKEAEDARDVAIARAERAEEALRACRSSVAEMVRDGRAYDCDSRALDMADAALSSPPADASTMGRNHIGDTTEMVGERERRLANSLDEILNYSGGADNALEDEYVMERAHAALAALEQKS